MSTPNEPTGQQLEEWVAEVGNPDLQPIVDGDGNVVEYRSVFDE